MKWPMSVGENDCSALQQVWASVKVSYIRTLFPSLSEHTITMHTYAFQPSPAEQPLLVFTSFFVWTLFIVTPSCFPLAQTDTKAAHVVSLCVRACVCVLTYHKPSRAVL